MKSYVVIGLGRFGTSVARELARLGNEVLVIDSDEEAVEEVSGDVTHAMIADATDEAVLRSIGVRNFDCVVVAIGGSLEKSVLATIMLKDLGAKQIVCKAQGGIHKRVLEQIGADRVIVPEHDMGRRLAQTLNNPNVLDYVEISEDCCVIDLTPPESWTGKSLLDVDVRRLYDILVVAVRKKDGSFISLPSAGYVIEPQDVLVVVGTPANIEKVQGGA